MKTQTANNFPQKGAETTKCLEKMIKNAYHQKGGRFLVSHPLW